MQRAKSPKRISEELGYELDRLEVFAQNVERHYRMMRIRKKPDQATGEDRGFRELHVPKPQLSTLHTKIKDKLLGRELSASVHGGVSGKSNVTNAKTHRANRFFFVTDLRDFFPSIRPYMVYCVLVKEGLTADAAHLFTRLTTFDGGVPQGSPSSMHFANLAFSPIDDVLEAICVEPGLTYTRFVDDLTFSSQKPFKSSVPHIINVISDGGFRINNRKTYFKVGSTEVTGIRAARSRLRPPKRLLEKLGRLEPDGLHYLGLKAYIEQIFGSSLN